MRIKVKETDWQSFAAMPIRPHRDPIRQGKLFRKLLKVLSASELKKCDFQATGLTSTELPDTPCLILMNHSAFIDLEIASTMLYPRQFHIVCTRDGFVGKEGLMRRIGCMPAKKFINDLVMIEDIRYALQKLGSDVLMYPEASYSFDGTATPLPESVGKVLKILKVPVVMIRTHGAFLHDPLYNGLRLRQTSVSADMRVLLTAEQIASEPVSKLNAVLKEAFTFDAFEEQRQNHIRISEDFRAEQLERVLFRCPVCGREDGMKGHGTKISCSCCGSTWELSEYGELVQESVSKGTVPVDTRSIPAWYAWEREVVRQEIEAGTYHLEEAVEILALKNTDAVYRVGEGVLIQDANGFTLEGCDGALHYTQSVLSSYSLYADYYWYELGDMISIGDTDVQYYCFPKNPDCHVARARLAAEELYRKAMAEKKEKRKNT